MKKLLLIALCAMPLTGCVKLANPAFVAAADAYADYASYYVPDEDVKTTFQAAVDAEKSRLGLEFDDVE